MAKALDDPFPEDISLLAGPESSSDEDDWYPCYFLISTLWEAAIGKFVLGDSMHTVFGRREFLVDESDSIDRRGCGGSVGKTGGGMANVVERAS